MSGLTTGRPRARLLAAKGGHVAVHSSLSAPHLPLGGYV